MTGEQTSPPCGRPLSRSTSLLFFKGWHGCNRGGCGGGGGGRGEGPGVVCSNLQPLFWQRYLGVPVALLSPRRPPPETSRMQHRRGLHELLLAISGHESQVVNELPNLRGAPAPTILDLQPRTDGRTSARMRRRRRTYAPPGARQTDRQTSERHAHTFAHSFTHSQARAPPPPLSSGPGIFGPSAATGIWGKARGGWASFACQRKRGHACIPGLETG